MTVKISKTRKLTIGMATFDDFHGVFFSIQAIRMYHKDAIDDIEFIIVDNNPDSEHGKAVKEFSTWIKEPITYLPYKELIGTSAREKIFSAAKTDYVLCMDCHVLLEAGSLRKLIDFYDSEQDNGNLIQGPLLYDDLQNIATHFQEEWDCQMFGKWSADDRGKDPTNESFEIPMQGLGVFSCRKSAWLGFSKEFKEFGCEEFYIAEKFRQAGKQVICAPFLRWNHRFARPDKIPYPMTTKGKFQNYILGFRELGLDLAPVREHFNDYHGKIDLINWENEITSPQSQ